MSTPPDQHQAPSGQGVYVPGPYGWVDAPPGHVPPLGWIPTPQGWQPAPPGWTPPSWWVRTPSGYLPPPQDGQPGPQPVAWAPSASWGDDGAPDAGTRGFGWTTVVPRTLQRAAQRSDRMPSGWELLVVLSLFPGVAVSTALVSLGQTLGNYSDNSTHSPDLLPHHGFTSAFFLFILVIWDFAPAFLAAYLMKQSGGGLRALGLDLHQPRADLSRMAKLILYSYVPGFFALGLLIHLTPHSGLIGSDPKHLSLWYILPSIVQSLSAGVVEEIVVLGFLVHRLEQRGWSGWQLYAVCIAVRLSYHLYYGSGAIGLAIWAGMSVFLYRRRRRLLTFIVAHAIWDTQAFLGQFFHGDVTWIPITGAIVTLAVLWLVGRAPAVEEVKESGRALRSRRDELPELA